MDNFDVSRFVSILQCSVEFIHHDVFDQENVKSVVFEKIVDAPEIDPSWFGVLTMDNCTENDVKEAAKLRQTIKLTAEQEYFMFLQMNFARYQVVSAKRNLVGGEFQRAQKGEKVMKITRLIGHADQVEKRVSKSIAESMIYWHNEANSLRDQLILLNLGLVVSRLKQFHKSIDFKEGVQEGVMGLMRAVDRFDVGTGLKFSTYAYHSISRSFFKMINEKKQRYEIDGCGSDTDYAEKAPKDSRNRIKIDYVPSDRREEIEAIKNLLDNGSKLTERERKIIVLRFGLDGDGSRTLEKVGKVFNLTRERVRQIENEALKKLKEAMV